MTNVTVLRQVQALEVGVLYHKMREATGFTCMQMDNAHFYKKADHATLELSHKVKARKSR